MSDKQFSIQAIEQLPDDVNLDAIVQRMDFLAGIRKGLDAIKNKETIPHKEVKRQLETWILKSVK